MLSVTSEAATSASFQNARQRSQREDRPPPEDAFGALVDINTQASTVQTSRPPDQYDVHSNASHPDRTAPAGDNAQTRGFQAPSGRRPQTDSAAGPDTGVLKSAADTETSNTIYHHRAKHEGADADVTKDASDSKPVAPDTAATDPTAPPQVVPPPVAVAVAAPVTTTPSTTAPTPAAEPVGSATESAQAAALLLAQQAGAMPAAPTATAAPAAQDSSTLLVAARAGQTGIETGFEGAASQSLAAAVAAATPAAAKPAGKTQEGAQFAKTASAITAGSQTDAAAADATTPASVVPGGPAAPASDHKHDAAATTDAKTSSSDTGTPAAQQGAAAPQHSTHATDVAAAPQPQPGQADSGQSQGLNSALAQPQVQSTATPVTPQYQYNVAVAANAAVPLNGLAVQIAVTALSGKSRFEIRLDPADLGRIDVRLDVDRQGRVTSHLTVEKPETLAMLRQDAPQLQRALQDAGLKTGDGGLQFSLRDQSSQGQTARDDTGRNARHLIVTDDIVPATTAGRNYGRSVGSSRGLDIRV